MLGFLQYHSSNKALTLVKSALYWRPEISIDYSGRFQNVFDPILSNKDGDNKAAAAGRQELLKSTEVLKHMRS